MRAAIFAVAGVLLSCVAADDAFTCCMGGWKELHGVTQCPLNCCHGYEERVLQLPRLQYPVVCQKLTHQQLMHKMRLAQLATATPPPIAAPTTPPPRLPAASLRHLRDISELLQELTDGSPEVPPLPPRERNERDLVQMQQRSPRTPRALLRRHASELKLLLAAGVSKEAILQAFDELLDELIDTI